jgi:hydrogenase maturation protein HypF
MKLESAAIKGKDIWKLEPKVESNVLNTTILVKKVFEQKGKVSNADLAYSAESYLAHGLAQLAIEHAKLMGIAHIGFSGGVAYNMHITSTIRGIVEKNGFNFVVHEKLPAGDGCISFGQALAASLQVK